MAHNKINSSNSVIPILEEVSVCARMEDHDQRRHECKGSHHHHCTQHPTHHISGVLTISAQISLTGDVRSIEIIII